MSPTWLYCSEARTAGGITGSTEPVCFRLRAVRWRPVNRPEKNSGFPGPAVATPCQYEFGTELHPVSVHRPGSLALALAGALSAARASTATAIRSGFTTSAYDEGVPQRDLLVEVVDDRQDAAVAAALEASHVEAVAAGVHAAAPDRPPRRALERVPHGRRLVQHEAELRALARALGLEVVDRVRHRVGADLDHALHEGPVLEAVVLEAAGRVEHVRVGRALRIRAVVDRPPRVRLPAGACGRVPLVGEGPRDRVAERHLPLGRLELEVDDVRAPVEGRRRGGGYERSEHRKRDREPVQPHRA